MRIALSIPKNFLRGQCKMRDAFALAPFQQTMGKCKLVSDFFLPPAERDPPRCRDIGAFRK
jgi:hypothetical protein